MRKLLAELTRTYLDLNYALFFGINKYPLIILGLSPILMGFVEGQGTSWTYKSLAFQKFETHQ